jgi:hypothetical protein
LAAVGEAGGGGAHEAAASRIGPPGEQDRQDISARLMASQKDGAPPIALQEAEGIAEELVKRAQSAHQKLAGGVSGWRLTDEI